jgi:LuxR family transcriptional regulator, maltose regulon positive regulatory protein
MPRFPSIAQGVLYPAGGEGPIVIGTPAWSAWIREHTTFTYQDAPLHFTARCEQRPGGLYWYAYKRAQGKLLKRYLGRGEDLTLQGLRDVAQQFALRAGASSHEPPLPSAASAASSHRSPERSPTTLLATRFHIPALPVHHIARHHLRDALEKGTKARLTLVCAPAGSGKTTLLAAWARTTAVPVAWLSLEEADNDPLRFLSYLMAALTRISAGSEERDAALPVTPHGSSWEEVLTSFVNDLARVLVRDTVLVLDDYHLMTAEPIHAALRFLIEHAPSHLQLLIGTRVDPPLPLARLRAHSQLSEMRVEELRFAPPEVQAFLRAMELDLTPDLHDVLEQRTQGWIVGIQLLALALRGQAQPATLLQTQPGAHPFFLEYVSEELLAHLPAEDRRFLLRTGILDRMTGALCEAVTGLSHGQRRLADLYRQNLLIHPLDDTGTWYSYHPLFAEALRTHLRRLEPQVVPELYRRASHWHEEHGDAEEACDYALQSGDLPHAANLLAELLPSLVVHGKFTRLSQWLDQVPRAEIEASPQLYVAALWRQVVGKYSPETVEKMIAPMERHLQEQSQHVSWVDLQSQLTLFHALAAFSQNNLLRTITLLQEALRSLSAHETGLSWLIALQLRMLLSIAYRASGNLVAAEQVLLVISIPPEVGTSHPLNLLAAWSLAELYEAQGQLRKWGSLYDTIFQALGPRVDPPPVPLALIQMSKAALLYEWNRLPEAAHVVQQALSITERPDLAVLSPPSRWLQARIELAQGHAETARHFLARQEPLLVHLLKGGIRPARSARLALACGQLEAASRWAETYRLRFDDPLQPISGYFEHMTLARVLLARGRGQRNGSLLSQALTLLERWRGIAVDRSFGGYLIEIQMLTALALAAQGKTRRALSTLGPILAQAEAEGYVRLFADEGQPMAHLLAQVPAYTTASPGYLQRLQAAVPPTQDAPALRAQADAHQSLIEPLSVREQEVLHLLAAGYSNQQIADQLVISLNTAKRHVKHILAKLTVTNRTQAVGRARALHLL